MRTLWFDITNTPHVHFLKPIVERYRGSVNVMISVRDYSEAVELARKNFSEKPKVIGGHGGSSRIKKVSKLLSRLNLLKKQINGFDYAVSCGGFEACLLAKLKRKVSVVFDDNDISPNWMYSRFADYAFFPKAVRMDVLQRQGFKASSLCQYDGYKEDIYIADYTPDVSFVRELPFENYVVVRPENVMASYSGQGTSTIVPRLLRLLSSAGFNILYLPRSGAERRYAYGLNKIYIPREPVSGLDASFFSRAVLSGAGSLTREAACLGKPAVSFYAGKRLLAVDQKMVRDGWLSHSRSPEKIVEYVKNAKPRRFERNRSKKVQRSMFNKLDEIIKK